MKRPTVAQMQTWADLATQRFGQPELQWLEERNSANVLYYRWLYYATTFIETTLAVELGVCRAEGSLHIAAAGPKLTVGIDIKPWQPEFDENISVMAKRGLNYHFILGASTAPDTLAQISTIVAREGSVGLLFIDTVHTYNQAFGEFQAYRQFLSPGALVVMDDILDPPEMYGAFVDVPGQHCEFPNLHIAGRGSVGFGAIIYNGGGN